MSNDRRAEVRRLLAILKSGLQTGASEQLLAGGVTALYRLVGRGDLVQPEALHSHGPQRP